MKIYSTNYKDVFIEVAEDCLLTSAEIPPEKKEKTAARIEYDLLINNPYKYTSDDVLFESNGARRGIDRDVFFSKGQPCFRASALAKRYGWGIHSDTDGKIAIYPIGSDEYNKFVNDESLKHLKAIRSTKK